MQRRGEGAVFVCPCCGEDLYARPARSYAEMEGLSRTGNSRAVSVRGAEAADWSCGSAAAALAATRQPRIKRLLKAIAALLFVDGRSGQG